MEFLTPLLTMKTNELIIAFVINNIVLLEIFRRFIGWVCKKTPFAWDDDLASFIGGLIDSIKKKKLNK